MKLNSLFFLILFLVSAGIISAQDYLISFEGSGATSSLNSVQIENITKATQLTISGTEVLHLKENVLADNPVSKDLGRIIGFSPNPMTDETVMRFITPETGFVTIALYDLSGKILIEQTDHLLMGLHTFSLRGIKKGIYFVRTTVDNFSCSGKLICSGSSVYSPEITHENTLSIRDFQNCAEAVMQFSRGDKLKITGFSGICSTVLYDSPEESKTIAFIFNPCTDSDGNNYPVVQIGSQLWMAENLKTTTYNDNFPIPNVTDGTEWANLVTDAYCWYGNNINNKDRYGALYNWYAVKTEKLCPSGWHVPSDAEWHQMVLSHDPDAVFSVAESNIAGGMLKEEGTAHWSQPNTGATDETGFTALPGGFRRYDGLFAGPTGNGNWRTSSQFDENTVWYRYILYHSGAIYRNTTNMQAGYSVRCISDF